MAQPSSSKKKGGNALSRAVKNLKIGSDQPRSDDDLFDVEIPRLFRRVEEVSDKASQKFDAKRHKDTKRSHIALVFVYSYVILIAIIIIGAPLYNAWFTQDAEPLDVERILAQAGALLGSALGFVLGYYFKEDK